ncbi:MAG TPA: response regulator transcription factor [bacterium]
MRILLIEDDKKIAATVSKSLRAESFAVDVAEDGLHGEELAASSDYDVLILDVMMPRQDGWQTCRNLRRAGVLTPILMLTALDDVSDKIKGLDTGADDYLTKPFHFGELVARLRSLVRRNSATKTSVIELYGLSLDQQRHCARREGTEIRLSAKEFALLEYFMLHPDTVLSREQISEHIWDMNFEPRSNVIEAAVKFLRQKIDKGFDKPLIHTVRGSGYIFAEREP